MPSVKSNAKDNKAKNSPEISELPSSSNTKSKGTNADNILPGADYDELADGKAGADEVNGGDGNDRVKGGSGDDVVQGGAGNDDVEAGSGDDQAIYAVTENASSTDTYDGGSGIDTLTLDMNLAEWMRDDVQADTARYPEFMDSHINSGSGQADGARFNFNAFDLEARRFEILGITVDGLALNPVDEEVTTNDDEATTSGEHSSVSGNVLANDLVPDLVRSVELISGPVLGLLSFDPEGSWNYDPGNDFDYLAEGESEEVRFSYQVTDADDDTDIGEVIITVTGTNDAPIAYADNTSSDENASVTFDVLANDTDVDASDTHTVDAVSVAPSLGVVTIQDNQVHWDPGTDFDYLAVGESTTVEIAYTMSDLHGAESESTLTLLVIGSNDLPLVSEIALGNDEDKPLLQVDLLSSASDVDASDVLAINSLVQTAGREAIVELLDSTLSFDPAQFNDLALNDSETLVFSFNVNDGHVDVANEISVVIEGRNDAPVVASALISSTNEEDEPYTIDLLGGASDADNGAILSAINITEAEGQGGWSVAGNILTVNPDYFDDLNNGETGTLNLNFQIVDEHGEAVDQSLTVNVEGFTDAPSLSVLALAGNSVNEVKLRITSAPANNERVMLSFAGLVAGSIVLDDQQHNVTAGIADYTGTSDFTLVLPEGQAVKDDLEITVSGIDDSGAVIGQTLQNIDISVDVVNRNAVQNFSSEDQNMWDSGENISAGWHDILLLWVQKLIRGAVAKSHYSISISTLMLLHGMHWRA